MATSRTRKRPGVRRFYHSVAKPSGLLQKLSLLDRLLAQMPVGRQERHITHAQKKRDNSEDARRQNHPGLSQYPVPFFSASAAPSCTAINPS